MLAALKAAGYLNTRRLRPTIVRTDPELTARLARHIDDWHFTKGDHDWDQVHPTPI